MKNLFSRLLDGTIIGCVDNYGAVHSQFSPFGNSTILIHSDIWPNIHHTRWRWTHDSGLRPSAIGMLFDEEVADAIRAHITKRYGLLWWENGFHDLDHLLAKCEAEKLK